MTTSSAPNCLLQAWHNHERELRLWLIHQLHDQHEAEDLLQDVFIKALREGERFCNIDNARAWLFQVTRNAMADHLRRKPDTVEVPESLIAEKSETAAVESLASCLPRVLMELNEVDRDAIVSCDLEGLSQEDYANKIGLSLPAAKSRVQRARKRLKATLAKNCQVHLDERGRVCCFVPRIPVGKDDHG